MLARALLGTTKNASVATVTYIGTTSSNTNSTSFTFNSVNIGGPGLIVVVVYGAEVSVGGVTLTSLTVNGNAATIHSNVSARDFAFMGSYRVTSGATANIAVTFSAASSRCLIAVYRIQNNITDTPVGQGQSWLDSNRTSANVAFTRPGSAVAVAGVCSSSGTATFTWTNATEQFDTIVEANSATSGAMRSLSSSNVTVTATSTVSSRLYLSAAMWV